jgi:dipeptidyl aminopeptidase/acylaminoacyl peptidase
MRYLRSFLVVIVLVATTSAFGQMTQDMILNMKFATSAVISPDGKTIAYTLSIPRTDDEAHGGRYSELWTMSTDGENAKQIMAKPGSAWSPKWSHDSKKLYFLAHLKDHSEYTQVYSVTKKDTEPKLVTEHTGSIASYTWSPDGSALAFLASDQMTEEKKKAIESGKDWIVDDGDPAMKRLWIMNWSGKMQKTFQVSSAGHHVEEYAWNSDNETLAYQASEKPLIDHIYMFKKIYTVTISGNGPNLVCNTEGKLGGIAFSPDGSKLAFLGAVSLNDPLAQSLFVVPTKGGAAKNLSTKAKYSGEQVFWINASNIGLLASESCYMSYYKVNASTGKASKIYGDGVIMRGLNMDKKGEQAVFLGSSPSNPYEVYISGTEPFNVKRLTFSNPEIENAKLAKQEVYNWKGADEWNIQGILTYPFNYEEGKKYPLVLQIHGGPEGVSLNGWNTRSLYPVQWLAAAGYFVLEPNYRGSGGFGVDFSKADHDDLGGKEFDDVLKGIDQLVTEGKVDGDRVGTGGWSYGGYFSAWAATRHSKRFKASVMAAGIANWVSFTGTSDIPYEMSLVHWNSWWFDKPELHWLRSPLAHVNTSSTPTLVVHGLKDVRVPPGQAYELYTALKIKNVPTSMVLYPREPHGIRERAHERDYMDRIMGWFDKYLKEGTATQ